MNTDEAILPHRIESKIAYEALTGCWLWTGALAHGSRQRGSYGQAWLDGKVEYAHRAVYFLVTGTRPPLLRHTCWVGLCVNPMHLRPSTNRDNMLDADIERTGSVTHCRLGHPRDEFEVIYRDGARRCRACHNPPAASRKVTADATR